MWPKVIIYMVIFAQFGSLAEASEDNKNEEQLRALTSPIVLKELGMILENKGLIALAAHNTLHTLMVQLKSPVSKEKVDSECHLKCDTKVVNMDAIMRTSGRCLKKGVIGVGAELYRVSDQTLQGCISHCMQLPLCVGVSFLLQKTGLGTCIFRKTLTKDYLDRENGVEVEKECLIEPHLQNCINKNPQNLLQKKLQTALAREVDQFWAEKAGALKILNALQYSRPQKRSPLAVGAAMGGVATVIALGYSFFSTQNVKKRVDRIEDQFQNFKSVISDLESRTLNIEDDIIRLMADYESVTDHKLNKLECATNVVTTQMLQRKAVEKFKTYINSLLSPLDIGKRTGPMSPILFTLEQLATVVGNSDSLNTTIYARNPAWMIPVSKFTIAKIDRKGDDFFLAFIIETPHIRGENVFPLYKIKQTSVRQNNTCIVFQTPENVYKKNGRFFKIDLDSCTTGETLKYCVQNNFKASKQFDEIEETPCLSDHPTHCKIKEVKCEERIVLNRGGLLIHTADTIYGALRNKSTTKAITTFKPEGNHVKYFAWDRYEYVQIKTEVLSSADHGITTIHKDYNKNNLWDGVLAGKLFEASKQNFTKVYGLLNEQRHHINKIGTSFILGRNYNLYIDIFSIISFSLWAIVILYFIMTPAIKLVWKHWKKYRTAYKIIKEQKEQDLHYTKADESQSDDDEESGKTKSQGRKRRRVESVQVQKTDGKSETIPEDTEIFSETTIPEEPIEAGKIHGPIREESEEVESQIQKSPEQPKRTDSYSRVSSGDETPEGSQDRRPWEHQQQFRFRPKSLTREEDEEEDDIYMLPKTQM